MKTLTSTIVVSALALISTITYGQEGENPQPEFSGCQFICETFESEATGVVERGTTNVLFNGGHTVDFETVSKGFTFFTSGGSVYNLGDQYIVGTTVVSWGRYLFPAVNFDESVLMFPPGIAVSLAYVRIRSAGGGDWTISTVDRNGDVISQNPVVNVDGTPNDPMSQFICGDFFSGLKFNSINDDAEPQVFEVCIPQDPNSCLAQQEN